MEHPTNLYDIEVAEPERDESELPQIVRMAMADFEDEYSHVVERYGIACHPQIVAATTESLQLPYLTLIMEQKPQPAASLPYGGPCCSGVSTRETKQMTQQMMHLATLRCFPEKPLNQLRKAS